MLEALDLSRELSKIDYHEQLPELQRRLHQLQRSCWEEKLATIVVLEGWDASGKGSVISKITRRLE
ncbi:MAG: polyphosphate:AMP phosphotransferase, partial [Thermoanaerobaculia bacterium]